METYGHYDDQAREFVITRPDTPWPWINYLGTDGLFGLISNTAGGYVFYRDAKFRRITRYRYNGVPMDAGGRYFYITEKGQPAWNPGWRPTKTPVDDYSCRHGLGYTRIASEHEGIKAETIFFIPAGANKPVEICILSLTNQSDRQRHLRLFSFIEWCLWNASTDMENFQRNFSTGEVEVEGSTIYHKTEYRERRNHYAFYTVNAPLSGFDTDREAFLGLYNGFDTPQVVTEREPRNSVAHGWSPIASHCLDIVLAPGETRQLVFQLGYVENPDDEKWASKGVINKSRARELMAHFDTPQKAWKAFDDLRRYWDGILANFSIKSSEKELERTANVWNQYQCMVTFNFSRSASYFESGIGRGMGFRDSNQDLVGFVHQIPERARQRILDIAATQMADGSCYHQYQPLTRRGNNDIGSGFNDDPMWLVFGTDAYIRETGDWSILSEEVPFNNEPGTEKPLLDHLHASFRHVVEHLGPHRLPLIGRADWNDCLNFNCNSHDPNESFQTTEHRHDGSKAESLMIAGQFVVCGRQFEALLRHRGLDKEADETAAHVKAMEQAIERHGWDGRWFLRAYDYFGNPFGSHTNKEGQIFIESQGWCVMAGVGLNDGKAIMALDSVKERLDSPQGIRLNAPAFTEYYPDYGEISSYPQGYKENAGVFTHNNPWIIIAETMAGNPDRAWEYFTKICPAYTAPDGQKLRRIEPYVYAQMTSGPDAALPGEAKNSWLTGTAAWAWLTLSQYILGIRPDYDGLLINPYLPSHIHDIDIDRRWRGATYHIHIQRANVDKIQLTLNGQPLSANLVPQQPEGSDNEVMALIPENKK